MKSINNKILIFFLVLFMPITNLLAFSGSVVNITGDGVANISGAKVVQLAGSSFFTRLYWGDSFIRMLVKTNSNTKFFRATGEATSVSEISVGDMLDLSGVLESGSDAFTLVVDTVKNSSVQKKQSIFSGKVTVVDLTNNVFTMNTVKNGVINVKVTTNTKFLKGLRMLDLQHLKAGDTVSKTAGDYDLPTKTLTAESVITYIDMNLFKPQNYEGTLISISSNSLPTTIKVLINKVEYTVNLNDKSQVLSKNRNVTVLSRFVVGDKVRFYGSMREVDDPIIDADIIRNLNL